MNMPARKAENRDSAQEDADVHVTRVVETPDVAQNENRRSQGSAFSAGYFAGLVVLCDIIAISLCGILSHIASPTEGIHTMAQHMAAVGLFGVLTILAFKSTGMYHFAAIVAPVRHALRISALVIVILVFLRVAASVFEVTSLFSASWALIWIACTIPALITFRVLFARLIRSLARNGHLGRRILIYGATDQAQKLIERIERLEEPWNYIVGIFDDRIGRIGPNFGRYQVMGKLDDLIRWGRQHALDEVLVALPWSAQARILEVTRSLAVLPANVRLCPEILHEEILHGRASHHYGLPMWNAFEKPMTGWDAIGKRGFDIVFSSFVLLASLPVFFVLALLIKLESRGPVLFKQKRYGFNNEIIEVYKFRSMKHELSDPDAKHLTERDDPRVTRIGRFMRRSSLDELPQLINVLCGEMSIVGPRPHAPSTTAGGKICEDVVDRYSRRHRVKPGITGWAQVNGYRGTMMEEEHLQKRIELDLYYIKNWSPWLDFKILALTLWIVIVGRNSY